MRLLLQPERRAQSERYFAITSATLARYGEWFGPYPYGYLTIVDPAFQSDSDGMEYPTLFTGRSRLFAPSSVQMPEMTTAHETGHQWWYGLVATNEFEHAWMDEGINTYAAARVLDEVFDPNRVEVRYFGGFIPWSLRDIPFSRLDNDRLPGYRLNPEADAPWTPTFRYWPSTAAIVSYNKTALWLHTLERRIGWPAMQRVLATYFQRWKFRHPKPADFFDVVREVTGQSYIWFFDEVYRSSNTFDYGVQELRSERVGDDMFRTTVVVRRFGEAAFPVDVATTFEDGQQILERWDGQDRRAIYVYTRGTRAASVQVDPDRVLLLDVAYTNNSRTLQPRGGEASLKWSLTWMVWLQDLMLTYGFFV
jgi:aminopeptidase N